MRKLNLKSFWLVLVLLCTSLCASAYDFEVDGIYYNKIQGAWNGNSYDYYVKVAPKFSDNSSNSVAYSGEVTIPATVTYEDITYDVRGIDSYAFKFCATVTKVTLPASVTSVGYEAFYDCSGLQEINMPGATSFVGYCFVQCSSLASISIAEGTTTLPHSMFNSCTGLTNVSLPSTLTSIENFVFNNCTSLESIVIPNNVSTLGIYVFNQCYKLKHAQLPSGIVAIPDYAFRCCNSLESISLPAGVESISREAFYGCSKLKNIHLPQSVIYISTDAFAECGSLTAFTVETGNTAFCASQGILLSADGTQIKLAPRALAGDITLPVGITTINENAFYNCSEITSMELPSTVTSIGSMAFRNCSKLKSITIPASVASIGDYVFLEDISLTLINYSGTMSQWCAIDFGNEYANPNCYNPNATLKIDGCAISSEVVIPDGVTSISAYAFYNNKSITSVSLPNSVTSIGTGAFTGTLAEKIVVNGSAPATVSSDAFLSTAFFFVPNDDVDTYKSSWSDLAARIFPQSSLSTEVETTAAEGKPALLDAIGGVGNEQNIISLKVKGTINGYDVIILRNKLTNLRYLDLSEAVIVEDENHHEYYTGYHTTNNVFGPYMFYGVDNLRSIVLPNTITSIGHYALASCNKLTDVLGMPETCTSIDGSAFSGSNVSNIVIGENVRSIGYGAFSSCANLKSIDIPASVKNIDGYCFSHCLKS